MAKKRGFTIVEIITAAAIFSMAILVIFATYSLTIKLTKEGREISIGSNLAQELIDQARTANFDSLAINANPTAVATSRLPGGFTKTYVSLYQGNEKIKEVRVDVYWTSRPEPRAITVTTLVTQGGTNATPTQ